MTIQFQCISETSSGYKLFVAHYKSARILNKKLGQYKDSDKLYTFKEGEEAVFHIQKEDLEFAKKAMAKYKCLF